VIVGTSRWEMLALVLVRDGSGSTAPVSAFFTKHDCIFWLDLMMSLSHSSRVRKLGMIDVWISVNLLDFGVRRVNGMESWNVGGIFLLVCIS